MQVTTIEMDRTQRRAATSFWSFLLRASLVTARRFPTALGNALMFFGLKTIGEVRGTSDIDLLRIPDLDNESVAIRAGR
jgi:hypothetical protein